MAKSSIESVDFDEDRNTTEKKTEIADSLFTRKTDKFTVEFSTKGGQITSLYLNDYKSYKNYSKGAKDALCLFTKGDHLTSYSFFDGDELIQTKNLDFELKNDSKTKVVLEAPYKKGIIRQTYQFTKNSYNKTSRTHNKRT